VLYLTFFCALAFSLPLTGLFYFQTTALSETLRYAQTFDQTIILSTDEGVTFNVSAVYEVVSRFPVGYKLYVELGNPKGSLTLPQLMNRLNSISMVMGRFIEGYYLTPEGSLYMYNSTATDGTLTRDNMKSLVDYIHSDLKQTAFWIPVEAAGGPLESFSFYWIFLATDYIGFDYVTPQPHYLQVKDKSGDPIRPIGMNFVDLVAFIKMSAKFGWGVEFEANQGVDGEKSDCGCGEDKNLCMQKSANYWCAYQRAGVNVTVSYYFSNSILYELEVEDFLSKNPCPTNGFPVC